MKERFTITDPDFEAEIYYLTTNEGGRQTPVGNGYRGQFYYDGNDYDAFQEFIGKDICILGDTVNVKMSVLTPKLHKNKLFVGKSFEVREGARIVGKGTITKIYNEDLKL